MITPSGVTSSAYWDAIKAGNPTHIRMVFDQDVVLDDQDINISTGIQITDVFNGDTDLTFGKAVSKQLHTNILMTNRTRLLPWYKEFRFDMGVEINGATNWVTIGYFTGEKPTNISTAESVDFTAYDRMTIFEQLADEFWSGLDFTTPLSLADIYHALCTYVGIQYMSGNELSASFNRTYNAAPMDITGYTCRDVLAWIAEAVGCYAKITADGKCKLVWFTDATSHEITWNEEFSVEHNDLYSGMTWDEFDAYTWNEAEVFTWDEVEGYYGATYGIRGVKVKQTNLGMDVDYPSVQPWNVYTIMDNPFLKIEDLVNDPVTYVKPIYDRLVAFGGQLPMTAECIGNWCIESGDIISIHIADEIIHAPLFMRTLKWNGTTIDEYEVTGQKFRQIINDSQKQRVINNRNIKLYVDGNFYDIKSGIEITEDGVIISGGKYIDIKSGSSFKVESGGNVNIKSGGKATIESGADLDVNSGGDLNIKSGGKINVASGADMEVASGGNVKIKSGGELKIESNGALNVDTTNFKLDSANKTIDIKTNNFTIDSTNQKFLAGPWTYDKDGMVMDKPADADVNCRRRIGIGDYRASSGLGENVPKCNWVAYIYPDSSQRYPYKMQWGMSFHCFDHGYGLTFEKNDMNNVIITASYTTDHVMPGGGALGTPSARWGSITVNSIDAYSCSGSSSRDIKHDIAPLSDVGSIIDRLTPVSFVFDHDTNEKKRFGLIYEDTLEVLPEICSGDEANKTINYIDLISVLLKEIQSLRTRVEQLEKR